MKFETSNCIARGVDNMRSAAEFYRDTLGWDISRETDKWIEMKTGALLIYLCQDEVREAAFDMRTDDLVGAEAYLVGRGFQKVDLGTEELFVRDPFGYLTCVSKSE